jgi:hypothetical protein
MSQLLVQNAKMKKSSKNGITVVNWTLPAFQSETGFKTCPMAGACVSGCYARSGTYRFKSSVSAHNWKLELSQSDTFVGTMIAEIELWLKKRSVDHLKLRIHDAGDFYSVSYLDKWIAIMSHFESNPRVSFYAYTKMVQMFQTEKPRLPSNFRAIFSFGGKQDNLIQIETDFHARVFETVEALEAAAYQNGTDDDMVAAIGVSNRVGLVYHGAKSYQNTTWGKVS